MALLEDDTVQFDDSTVVFHAKFIDFPHMYFDQKEFGLRVKYLRRKHGLTQEQLADALYITATHLSKIECGQRGISIDLLLDLAAELGVSVDFLISGNPRTMGSVRMLIAQIRELLDRVESSEMD